MRCGDIEAYRMSFEPVHAPLALLEVDRIARQIPMVDSVAVRVKVEPLLTDRCRGKDEGTEGRVERLPNRSEPDSPAFLVLRLGQAHCEPAAHPDVRPQHDPPIFDAHQ